MNRLEQQMNFIMEVDKLKTIYRQNYITGGTRKENDAEHSWHLAMMAYLLGEHSNEEIDVLKTIGMLLIHDLVEIDAGDTYAFDNIGSVDKFDRERQAASRIFSLLPEDQGKKMMDLWLDFEEQNTPESKFANAIDKIQPVLLHKITDGKSWKEHNVSLSQIEKRQEKTPEASTKIWEYAKEIIDEHVEKGNITL